MLWSFSGIFSAEYRITFCTCSTKIENTEIKIIAKKDDATSSENGINNGLQMNESGEEMEGPSSTEEIIFNGYANVIPIRGKESALDYYLMVLSTEVFV